jgi:putative membrane protein
MEVITTTREANRMTIPVPNIINAAVFALLGILIFVAAFFLLDKLTPYHLWNEIVHEHNVALAILIGALSIGICMIIAAAVQ